MQKLFLGAFANEIRSDAARVANALSKAQFGGKCDKFYLNGQELWLFGRLYTDVSLHNACKNLDQNGREILLCTFLKHHGGFIRQEAAQWLVKGKISEHCAAFLLSLLGEYVYEIFPIIKAAIIKKPEIFYDFARQNDEFIAKLKNRAASYYDAYHRDKSANLQGYTAYEVLNALQKRAKI